MSKKLRVLTIGHSYVVALNQAVPAAIAKDPDVDVTVAAPSFHYGDLRRLKLERTTHPDYAIVPLDAKLTRWNQLFWYDNGALRKLIRSGDFDVVHAWEEPYCVAGYQIAQAVRETSARFMFRTAQSLVKRYPWPFSKFERTTVARADGWVAGGQLVYEAMVRKGFPEAAGRVITLGVDMNRFQPLPAAGRDELRRSLGLNEPVIGFIGRLVKAKGLDLLMDALLKVRGGWSLLVLGAGPYKDLIESWAARHGLQDCVRVLLVKHDDVPRYLGAMDMLVAPSQTTPSWKEQFGRMVIESFACRVPVIGSDSGEIPRVIDDAGIVVGESDVHGWTEAIERLLSDVETRQRLAERGLERCRAHYSVERIAERYIEFYRLLVSGSQT